MYNPQDQRNNILRLSLNFFLSLFSGLTISSILLISIFSDLNKYLHLQVVLSQMGLFIIPVLLFGTLEYKSKFISKFAADRLPKINHLLLSLLAVLTGFFFIQYVYELNKMLPFPGWMVSQDSEKVNLTEQLLNMSNISHLLINLMVIGLLPAIGEEFMFRGIIQKYTIKLTQKPWLGILLSAFIFSAIHFQFQGFFPRLLLGCVLGYLYWMSRSIWLPVIVHFFNNAYQIILHYLYVKGKSDFNLLEDITVSWHTAIISGIATGVVLTFLHRSINKTNRINL